MAGTAWPHSSTGSSPLYPAMVERASPLELIFYGLDYDTLQAVLIEVAGPNITPESCMDRAFRSAVILQVPCRGDIGAIKARIGQFLRRRGIMGGVFLSNSSRLVVYGAHP